MQNKKTLKFILIMILVTGVMAAGRVCHAVDSDFETLEITTKPATPAANVESEITVKIKYTGINNFTNSSIVSSYNYEFNNFELRSRELPAVSAASPVKPGGFIYYKFTGIFREVGRQALSFNFNTDYPELEISLTNNDYLTHIEVVEPDDLQPVSIELSPAYPTVNQDCVINVKLKNNGYRDLTLDTGIKSYTYNFADFETSKFTPPTVSASEIFEKNKYVYYRIEGHFMSAGEKNLEFNVDPDDYLAENNENNNAIEKNISIAKKDKIDIAVSEIDFSGDNSRMLINDDVVITVKIKNTGGVSLDSGAGFEDKDCYYNFDGIKINYSVHDDYPRAGNYMDPGDVFEYKYYGKYMSSGNYDIKFQIDKSGILSESDESNNTKMKPITIYATEADIDYFAILNVGYAFNSSSSTVVTWQTSKNSDGYVKYSPSNYLNFSIFNIKPRIEDWPSDTDTQDHSVTLKNLIPGREYKFQIFGKNNEVEKQSGIIKFIMPESDIPKLSGDIIFKVDGSAGTVEAVWNTNILSKSYLYYKLHDSGEYSSAGSDEYTTSHKVNLADLSDGQYDYYVYSKGKFKYYYKSDVRTFTIGTPSGPEENQSGVKEEPDNESSKEDSHEAGRESDNNVLAVSGGSLYNRLKGNILLKVESAGEAYYVDPRGQNMYYLGRPKDAFEIMRERGIGIKTNDLEKIAVGLGNLSGTDTDKDGLTDLFEDAVGTDKNKIDSDGDGFSDKEELESGFSPLKKTAKLNIDNNFANAQKGKIFIQVESHGEAWYINPADGKRYFLGRPADAFNAMRYLGTGISESDFSSML